MTEPRPRVHVLADTADPARPNACAVLRLLDPYASPAVAAVADVSFGPVLPPDPVRVLVLQRLARGAGEALDLVRTLKAQNTRLLYDLDDNLLDPHPDPASEQEIAPHRPGIRALLRAADHVSVSTAPLRDRVLRLNPAVSVLPNALDDRRIGPARIPADRTRLHIGYFGTFTHLRDLMVVAGPLRAALSQLGRPRLSLCGISGDPRLAALFAEVAEVDLLPATGDYDGFMGLMRTGMDWDIGLAPLAGGAFERTKSDIKFLEQAAFGIPGLYSAHPAYAAVRHGVTGLLASPAEWADALLALANNAERRRSIAAAASAYVRTERVLSVRGRDWAGLLRQLCPPGEPG